MIRIAYRQPIPFRNANDVLYVHFLNIGEGECTLVQMPTKNGFRNILIDIGKGGFESLQKILTILNVKKIDHALITHPHEDHCTEMNLVLEHHPDLKVWIPKCYPDDAVKYYTDLFKVNFEKLLFPKMGLLVPQSMNLVSFRA